MMKRLSVIATAIAALAACNSAKTEPVVAQVEPVVAVAPALPQIYTSEISVPEQAVDGVTFTANFEFNGLKDCVKMANEFVELVIAPSNGHVLYMGTPGGKSNLLWVNQDLAGRNYSRNEAELQWQDIGGIRTWISPEEVNLALLKRNFPQAYELDGAAQATVAVKDGALVVSSHPAEQLGCRIERSYKLVKNELVMSTTVIGANADHRNLLGPLTITQFNRPDAITFDRSVEKVEHPEGYLTLLGQLPEVSKDENGRFALKVPVENASDWKFGMKAGFVQFQFKDYILTVTATQLSNVVPPSNCNFAVTVPETPTDFVEFSHIGLHGSVEGSNATTSTVRYFFELR